MAKRWPWNSVSGFKAESRADGTILVTPLWDEAKYNLPWTPERGGGPGLPTRMYMASWIEGRLKKRSHRVGEKR